MTATTAEKKDMWRMTAMLEEKNRPYETAEETDATDAKETDVTDVKETNATHATHAKEMDAMDVKETDTMNVMDTKETYTLTIPLVTSNDLRGLPPSAWR